MRTVTVSTPVPENATCPPVPCSVTASATDDESIVAAPRRHRAQRVRAHVLGEQHVRRRDEAREAVGQHRRRATTRLLVGLQERHDRSGPRGARRGEPVHGREERRHVHVVPARSRPRPPAAERRAPARRVRQTARLADRERVELGAQRDHRAGAVAQHPDHSVTADAFAHVHTRRPKVRGGARGRLPLATRELGCGVQLAVQAPGRLRAVVAQGREARGRRRRHPRPHSWS